MQRYSMLAKPEDCKMVIALFTAAGLAVAGLIWLTDCLLRLRSDMRDLHAEMREMRAELRADIRKVEGRHQLK